MNEIKGRGFLGFVANEELQENARRINAFIKHNRLSIKRIKIYAKKKQLAKSVAVAVNEIENAGKIHELNKASVDIAHKINEELKIKPKKSRPAPNTPKKPPQKMPQKIPIAERVPSKPIKKESSEYLVGQYVMAVHCDICGAPVSSKLQINRVGTIEIYVYPCNCQVEKLLDAKTKEIQTAVTNALRGEKTDA